MSDAEDELAALSRILSLPRDELHHLAVELRIKKNWNISDEQAADEQDRLLVAIIAQSFNLRELILLAKCVGVKKDGVGWGSHGTPNKTKADIATALLEKRKDIPLNTGCASGSELVDRPYTGDYGAIVHIGSDVADDVADLVVAVSQNVQKLRDAMEHDSADTLSRALKIAESSMQQMLTLAHTRLEALTHLDVNSGSAGKVTKQMWEDFTLADLVHFAKERGLKKDGINWGKDGTPNKTKRDIIAALVRHEQRSSERGWTEDYKDVQIETNHWLNFFVEEGVHVPDEFMDRKTYRAHLQRTVGLHHDQDVFHIIAAANGGPDHPDNYLGALGGIFNRSVGDKMDYFCCFIAGLEKTEKAIQRALEAEKLYRSDPKGFAKVIDKRHHERPTLFSENVYNGGLGRCLTAAEMVDRGRSCWFRMRIAALD